MEVTRPRLLDLFCCEGGAAKGYLDAGFDVVGVDITPTLNYPSVMAVADALQFFARNWADFDAVHASPPCQDHSTLKSMHDGHGTAWLLGATRGAFEASDLPWVIENVVGAEMPGSVILCGSMFGLGTDCSDGVYRQLRRHRQFETSFPLTAPGPCAHVGQPVGVYGTGGGGQMTRGYKGKPEESKAAMGIDWMSRKGLSQAIPPAYSEWVGRQLMSHLAAADLGLVA